VRVKLGKPKAPVSSMESQAFEQSVGARLPDDYKRFLAQHNGSEPETNIFRIDDTNDSGVNGFIPFAQIPAERALINEELPDRAIPVAWAEGGNYVFLHLQQNGSAFFWDHEDPEQPTKLSDTFSEFLDLLKPFDVSSIELKPGQVKSVWIDPDLLR
jgi:hypothetical protein